MAGVKRGWINPLAMVVLLVEAATFAAGQSAERGSVAGKLTDLHSAPVDGATVVLRNETTGAEVRTSTEKNGSYRFSGLEAGEYTLQAESPQLGQGRLEGILVLAGHEERLQTAMEFELPPARPMQMAVHKIAPATPPVTATVAAEPLQTLPLIGRRWPDATEQMPAATVAAQTGTAPVPASLHAAPQQLGAVNPEAAKIGPPSGGLTASAPGSPGIAGTGAGGGPGELREASSGGHGLALSEAAARLAQAAMEVAQPHPIQGASHDVDPTTPAVTTIMVAAELQGLPASGRRWQDFVLDTPTAAAPPGGGSETSLRGAGQEPAEATIDGATTRLAFGGSSGAGPGSSGPGANGQGGAEQNGMGQAWAGGRGMVVAEAAIREVETAAGNVEAEGARAAGGRINLETQSGETERGGNGLHGRGSSSTARTPGGRRIRLRSG